ncbi:MAG TPA: NADH-quinone oxidoreductase subunit A [Cytophagales bacterium]|nr:NADH-quinone oxidoreductase subunit A [Cytophagales bacterium]
MISEFGEVLLMIIGGLLFLLITMLVAKLIRPKNPNIEKLSTYECGEEPTGDAWGQFNVRFYIIALVFVLFDVELVFIFPWATVFGNKAVIAETNGLWGWLSLVEMFIFIGILVLGLAYVWVKGYLNWVKPEPKIPEFKSPVPRNLYNKINERY